MQNGGIGSRRNRPEPIPPVYTMRNPDADSEVRFLWRRTDVENRRKGCIVREIQCEVNVRTEAPVQAVWDEISPLDHLLENVPTVVSWECDGAGTRATIVGWFARRPRVWSSLTGTAEVTEAMEPERLRWMTTVPSLELTSEGTFELTPLGLGETSLTYRGVLRCGDRYAGCLRHVLTGVLEGHLESVAARVATRAERRTLAERTLGQA
jgi:hypothetical protein